MLAPAPMVRIRCECYRKGKGNEFRDETELFLLFVDIFWIERCVVHLSPVGVNNDGGVAPGALYANTPFKVINLRGIYICGLISQ